MRLNNKGFAISGVLYSMLILIITLMFLVLGILAGRRTTLSKIGNESQQSVEDRVVVREKTVCSSINFNSSVVYAYDSSQLEREVELDSGYYLIQAWGASGVKHNTYNGGKGAYAATIYYTDTAQKVYINLGGSDETGYNGGGASASGGNGGGATSVSTTSGELKDLQSNPSSIILVAAGGGGAGYTTVGGAGGDLTSGVNGKGGSKGTLAYAGKGATATSGGAGGSQYSSHASSAGNAGSFGLGGAASSRSATYVGGGGGGGYYGGGGGSSYNSTRFGSGGGGVSYIDKTSLVSTKKIVNNGGVFAANTAYKNYVGVGINGNSTMPTPGTDSTVTEEILTQTQNGNSTTGYVRITKMNCSIIID